MSCFLMSCLSNYLILRDPHLRAPFLPNNLQTPFCSLFASFLSTLFLPGFTPKGLKMGSSKQQKIRKNQKNNNQNASTIKTCKKTLSGRGQTIKIDDSFTLFTVFSKPQGSQNDVKMGPEIKPQGTQKHKKSKKRALEKHKKNSTAQSELWVRFCL